MKIKISPGNMKLGKIPNISLPPVISCRSDTPCTRDCYAKKAYRLYSSAKKAWDANWQLWQIDADEYFAQITDWLIKHKPRVFRWHVAGDAPSQSYVDRMKQVTGDVPETRFLCFTKRFDFDFTGAPPNLTIVFSMWPGLETPEGAPFHSAWMQDGTETRIPENAMECAGNCESCGQLCWYLNEIGRDVVFHKH